MSLKDVMQSDIAMLKRLGEFWEKAFYIRTKLGNTNLVERRFEVTIVQRSLTEEQLGNILTLDGSSSQLVCALFTDEWPEDMPKPNRNDYLDFKEKNGA